MTDVTVEKELIVWKDIWQAAHVWQINDATMNFEILDLVAFSEDDGPTYWRKGEVCSLPGTTDPHDAEIEVSGFIKFDSCSHWSYNNEGPQHICGRLNLIQFQTAQQRLFDEAAKRILAWCGDD